MIELSPAIIKMIRLDFWVFALELFFLCLIIIKLAKPGERLFFFLYGIVELSAYNIYIKIIHDYNIPIARTFIFKKKLILNMSLFDTFIIISFSMLIFWKILFKPQNILYKKNKNSFYALIGIPILIYFTSLLGYFMYTIGDPKLGDIWEQLKPIRSIMAFYVSFVFYEQIYKKTNNELELKRIIFILLCIDLVNILGEFISANFIFKSIVWERHHHDVILLDQANNSLLYLSFIGTSKIFNIFKIFGFFYSSLLFYNYVKSFIISFFLFLGFNFIFDLIQKKGNYTKFLIGLSIIFITIIISITLFSDRAISSTRYLQLKQYIAFTQNYPQSFLFGTGFGGKYLKTIDSHDLGETKAIDRQNQKDNLSVIFQVPCVIYFKTAGFLGIFFAMIMLTWLFINAIHTKNRGLRNFYLIMFLINMLYPALLNKNPSGLFNFLVIFFVYLTYKKIVTNKEAKDVSD